MKLSEGEKEIVDLLDLKVNVEKKEMQDLLKICACVCQIPTVSKNLELNDDKGCFFIDNPLTDVKQDVKE